MSLKNGEFGLCEKQLASYRSQCQKLFPYATVFQTSKADTPVTNHVDASTATVIANGEPEEHVSQDLSVVSKLLSHLKEIQ